MDYTRVAPTLDECIGCIVALPPLRGESPHKLVARLRMCCFMCYALYSQCKISSEQLQYLATHDHDAVVAYRMAVAHMSDRHRRWLLRYMQKLSVEECMDMVAPMPLSSLMRLLQCAETLDKCAETLDKATYFAIAFNVNKDFELRRAVAVREYIQFMVENEHMSPVRGGCVVVGLISRGTCNAFLECDICPPHLRASVNVRLVYLIAFGDKNV